MRALAGFVMRGRREALLVAVVASVVPMFFWVGSAAVGLFTLRRGGTEGGFVALWALLPCLVLARFGEVVPAAAMIGIWLVAMVLRATRSWALTLLAASAIGLVFGLGLLGAGGAYLEAVRTIAEGFIAEVGKRSGDPAVAAQLQAPDTQQIASIFGFMLALTLVGCTVLARWWQSALFNPGGFREEFHAIRFGSVPGLALVGAGASLYLQGPAMQIWAQIVMLPLLVACIGLVHALVARRRVGGMLGLLYAALLLAPPVKYVVMGLAAVDAVANLRRLLGVAPPPPGKD
jgi:hypothetical protein